ncbi:proteasome subunit beta type-5-like [Argiope bruennichi]|uniref:Proteasome subunit beta n=1 Tax=Argiope bruennichi TaxID=94029 RepID=A0A8T0EWK0_ARGBR|nr:proteasome subunit beta type-5-like [Argiope bruennichi]KAF8782716.1 Proteasome subunit beta type-5 like protein [Argiope bruennichi]
MALEALCGVSTNFGFGQKSENENDILNFISKNSANLSCHTQLALPPVRAPSEAFKIFDKDEHGKRIKIEFRKGTTTLAFKYKGGVIVAVDSRATGGSFINSNEVEKIIAINDYLLGTMAGGAADCVYWERILSERCRIYELRNRERISVAAASKLLANIMFNYKGMGLSLGVMISGWDKRGPGLYYVDSEGNRFPGDVFAVGSGATYAYGVLDGGYKYDLEDEDAYELGRRAIYHATHRDAYSGGLIRVCHVRETGWKLISVEDCTKLHYKYQDEKMV